MTLDLLLPLLPVACVALVAAGVLLDGRLARRSRDAAAATDERFALAMVADSLMRSLDLRPECRAALVAELQRERVLVFAWLASRPSAPRTHAA